MIITCEAIIETELTAELREKDSFLQQFSSAPDLNWDHHPPQQISSIHHRNALLFPPFSQISKL